MVIFTWVSLRRIARVGEWGVGDEAPVWWRPCTWVVVKVDSVQAVVGFSGAWLKVRVDGGDPAVGTTGVGWCAGKGPPEGHRRARGAVGTTAYWQRCAGAAAGRGVQKQPVGYPTTQ
ncbi:hypothetical protein V6N11_075318 [Hibiscus sabdariffa]|uniref:Uncharacterized protein n=1 Tax=Hibiscus sabdariffa TaxID=183260 RepID=A0ABR2R6M8_9ROSI